MVRPDDILNSNVLFLVLKTQAAVVCFLMLLFNTVILGAIVDWQIGGRDFLDFFFSFFNVNSASQFPSHSPTKTTATCP